jgi:hypothetical protein
MGCAGCETLVVVHLQRQHGLRNLEALGMQKGPIRRTALLAHNRRNQHVADWGSRHIGADP